VVELVRGKSIGAVVAPPCSVGRVAFAAERLGALRRGLEPFPVRALHAAPLVLTRACRVLYALKLPSSSIAASQAQSGLPRFSSN
jgi:hypothetical protein